MPKLTSESVRSFVATKNGSDIRWDSELIGFGVRVYASGKKSFVFGRRNAQGKWKIKVLGKCEQLTLANARAIARGLTGSTPHGDATLQQVWSIYLERHAKAHRSSWRDDLTRMNLHVLPTLGCRLMANIKPMDLLALHSEISKEHPTGANRVIELLRAIYNKANTWELYEGKNIPALIERNKETHRERWLEPKEISRLFSALQNEPNKNAAAAIELLLYTGLRKRELLRAKWSDILTQKTNDEKELQILSVSRTKNRTPHLVPLSSAAQKVLAKLPRNKSNPFIIAGKKPGQHLINLEKPWRRICAEAELTNVRIHDIRHTVASWILNMGISDEAAMQILNQRSPKAFRRYAHLHRSTRSTALEQLATQLGRTKLAA